jgi:N6-adenosine-specific RNA methylase IME4
VICADPPWPFEFPIGQSRKSVERHYPTMSIQHLTTLPILEFAADDCVLFIWSPDSHLERAMDLIRAWGFEYKTVAFNWVKTNRTGSYHVGLGWWTRANSELCLLATRGHPQRLHSDVQRLVVSPLREHSRKPDEIYSTLIPRLVSGPYLELFARTRREGWDVVLSNEPDHFNSSGSNPTTEPG